jgi:hypothetical protein
MSVRLLPRPSRPSSRSMMKVSVIMPSIFAMPEMASRTSRTLRSLTPSVMALEMLKLWKRAMKKLKMVADLLTVADICIEAFKAWARLLESHGKGPSRKRDDREVNTVE